jgi:ABC-type transport system involved in cytochrome bd biosynthesis fused ATPase/permease subunit
VTQSPQQRSDGRPDAARTIIEVSHVSKEFTSPDGSPLPVLEDITLELVEGEIVALLPFWLREEHASSLHRRPH